MAGRTNLQITTAEVVVAGRPDPVGSVQAVAAAGAVEAEASPEVVVALAVAEAAAAGSYR